MIFFYFVNNFLEFLILFNSFLNNRCCVNSLNNLLSNCSYLFLGHFICFFGNYCYIIGLFINKSNNYCVLLRLFRISCDDSGLHCIVRCFCDCWNYLGIFRQCRRFNDWRYDALDGFRIFDNFQIICDLCLKSWNCIDSVLSFAW